MEGTTEGDTREDYILLSQRLKWCVSLRGYDLKVRPRGLATCRHMVVAYLQAPASNFLPNASLVPLVPELSRSSQSGSGVVKDKTVFPTELARASQSSISSLNQYPPTCQSSMSSPMSSPCFKSPSLMLSRADEEESSSSLYRRGNYAANNRVHLEPQVESFDSASPPVHPQG